jgi:hypothetical protein
MVKIIGDAFKHGFDVGDIVQFGNFCYRVLENGCATQVPQEGDRYKIYFCNDKSEYYLVRKAEAKDKSYGFKN